MLSIGSRRDEQKARRKAQERKRKNALITMNYAFQNLESSRQDAFDGAVSDLEKIRMNTRGLQKGVEASVAQDIGEGRTARAINRATRAEALRAEGSVKDNYERQSNEVDLNKEQQYLNTKTYIESLVMPSLPSFTDVATDLAQGYLSYRAERYSNKHKPINPYENSPTPTKYNVIRPEYTKNLQTNYFNTKRTFEYARDFGLERGVMFNYAPYRLAMRSPFADNLGANALNSPFTAIYTGSKFKDFTPQGMMKGVIK